MEEIEVKGLVLRDLSIKDYDKLLVILTSEMGKITVSGKGVKSLKSKNMPSCQPFAYATFFLKKKGEYYYISDTELIDFFYGLRFDIEAYALASYVCDVADSITVENNDENGILRLTLNTLYAIASGKKNMKQIKTAFEIRAALESGFMPDLTGCGICGDKGEHVFYLDVMNGMLLCEKCMSKQKAMVDPITDIDAYGNRFICLRLDYDLQCAMRYITYAEPQRFLSFSLEEDRLEALCHVSEIYLINHIEKKFPTLEFYREIIRK